MGTRFSNRCSPATVALMLLLGGSAAQARPDQPTEEPPSGSGDPRVLLVLQVAPEPEGAERERRFTRELQMTLDGIPVRTVAPTGAGFVNLALGDQIASVRRLIETHNAVAAAWLSEVSPDLLLLHMVAVSSGRALVRLVEIEPTEGFEADLALSARELLGTAFLFYDLPDQADDSPVSKVVESVRHEATTDRDRDQWLLIPSARSEGGVYGHEGPSIQAGGAVSLDVHLSAGLYGRLAFGAAGGYLDAPSEGSMGMWSLKPAAGLTYLWQLGAVTVGPVLELQISWFKTKVDLEESDEQSFTYFNFRLTALGEIHWHLTNRLTLLIGGGIGLNPQRDTFIRMSTDGAELTTPFVNWEARLGIVAGFL